MREARRDKEEEETSVGFRVLLYMRFSRYFFEGAVDR